MTAVEQPDRVRRITAQTIEALERRIGIPVRRTVNAHVIETTADSIRHFTNGIGQDDALHCDLVYGADGPWGSVIAPPLYFSCTGTREPVEWTPEQTEAMSGGDPLAGIGQYLVRERWHFHRPVRPGVRLLQRQSLHRVENRGAPDIGPLRVTHRVTHLSGDGTVYADADREFHHADRDSIHADDSAIAAASRRQPIEHAYYDDEALAAIDAAYAAEMPRGAQRLPIEQIRVGDELPVIVRGPLTVTDIISYHIGNGWGSFGGGPTRLAWKNRQRIPKLFELNAAGVPDTVQRCHWEDEWARTLGQPLAYDYGAMRSNWATALIRNWMGDAGWLWRFESRILKFNHRGDTTWLSGEVTNIRPDDGQIDISVRGQNQRGITTYVATATIVVPVGDETLARIPLRPEGGQP